MKSRHSFPSPSKNCTEKKRKTVNYLAGVWAKLEDIRRRAETLSGPDLFDAVESSIKECILANTDMASTYTIKSASPVLPVN